MSDNPNTLPNLDAIISEGEQHHHSTAKGEIEGSRDEDMLLELASMHPIEYDKIRKETAKKMGVQVKTLDCEVKSIRETLDDDTDSIFETLEPWPEEVDIADLLSEIKGIVESFVVLQEGSPIALPLWIAGTYVYEPLRIFPKLMVVSPEKRCGKTTLLEVIEAILPRPVMASNISSAVIYRMVELHRPTLLLDELDTFLPNNPELHGIINSGHTKKGASILRCDGDDNEPKRFSTWSPMVLAGIKLAGDTIIDRSVVIQLRRKTKGETVQTIPVNFTDQCLALRRKLLRWAEENANTIADKIEKDRTSALPDIGNDRALDNWTPLATIAEMAGGDWVKDCATAFEKLTPKDEGEAIGAMLLEDIRKTFEVTGRDKIHSAELVRELCCMDERPWPEWKHGREMTVRSLAILLKSYGIKSRQIRIDDVNKNGLEIEQFADAFERYLS